MRAALRFVGQLVGLALVCVVVALLAWALNNGVDAIARSGL